MPKPSRIANLSPAAATALIGDTSRQEYSDQELLDQLVTCEQIIGKSPTMQEFLACKFVHAHPQTFIARFGSWNEAKRKAGLTLRRFVTTEQLTSQLAELGKMLGRVPTSADVAAAHKAGKTSSLSTYKHHFRTLPLALQEAGFDVPASVDEKLDQAIACAVAICDGNIEAIPTMTEWAKLRKDGADLPSEWQVYRMCQTEHGKPWALFQGLVAEAIGGDEQAVAA